MQRELAVPFGEIGRKLRDYRIESGLRAEEIAARLGVSRAALYRYEKGDVIKIETIVRLSELLGIPLLRLLGIDCAFHAGPAQFADEVARLEEEAEQIIFVGGGFCPLLMLPETERHIARSWDEHALAGAGLLTDSMVERALAQLRQRLRLHQQRRPPITAILEEAAVERLLGAGIAGTGRAAARAAARAEIAGLAALAEALPIGVQIGLLGAQALTTPFEVIRTKQRTHVCAAPFPVDAPPGAALGVAMVTSAEDAVAAHQRIAEQAWNAARKGKEAAEGLRALLAAD